MSVLARDYARKVLKYGWKAGFNIHCDWSLETVECLNIALAECHKLAKKQLLASGRTPGIAEGVDHRPSAIQVLGARKVVLRIGCRFHAVEAPRGPERAI